MLHLPTGENCKNGDGSLPKQLRAKSRKREFRIVCSGTWTKHFIESGSGVIRKKVLCEP